MLTSLLCCVLQIKAGSKPITREKTGGGGYELVRAAVARSRVAGMSDGHLADNLSTHITEVPWHAIRTLK